MKSLKHKITASLLTVLFTLIVFTAAFFAGVVIEKKSALNPKIPEALNAAENDALQEKLDLLFPQRTELLHNLSFEYEFPELNINAKSAVLIDARSGNILYEKNPDLKIPPASMTKLVEMYVVLDEVSKGNFSLDDEVPLPKECWWQNMPSDASLMYLTQGQHVTLKELLLGLSIASGNDASVAVAHYICTDMDSFVNKMNSLVENMGLAETHFVESSGYDSRNITTARDFAAFSKNYIQRFPFVIEDFHSQKILEYPKEHNLPSWANPESPVNKPIIQYNTNKMLGKSGVDGLKTGFIYESGYNIALTAQKNGDRYISVTMGGPGSNSKEGNFYRNQDGTSLMEYAFGNFSTYVPEECHSVTVGLLGSEKKSIYLIPAEDEKFSVPFTAGTSPQEAASLVEVQMEFPPVIFGKVEKGTSYGKINYILGGKVLRTISLVADRDSEESNFISRAMGKAALLLIK